MARKGGRENEPIFVVYHHLHPVTGELFYVGMGTKVRPYQRVQRSRIWRNYVDKYGFPTVKIIAECLTWFEACELEVSEIQKYGRRDRRPDGILINLTDGGEGAGGRNLTEEEREHLRKKHTGKKMSADSCRRMSEAKKGRRVNNKEGIRRPVACYTKSGIRLREYTDSYEATKDGFNQNMVRRTATLKSAHTNGHFFVELQDEKCPAFMSIRIHLANKPRKPYSQEALANIIAGNRRAAAEKVLRNRTSQWLTH